MSTTPTPFSEIKHTERGFEIIDCQGDYKASLEIQQSSVGRDDGPPGSSALWFRANDEGLHVSVHLDRSAVEEMVKRLQCWLNTGSFEYKAP